MIYIKSSLKYLPLLILLFVKINFCIGQINLVPNPSFESYTICPNGLSEINEAIGWDSFNGTPDYFNQCSTDPSADVPNNAFGYQLPFNGDSYAGIIAYYNGGLAREIMGTQLTTPLSISQKYFVSFMVNRGNDNVFVGYSTNKVGVKLTNMKSYTVNINNTAHFYNNAIVTDTLNWVRIFGSFIVDSAYQYLMIGNFFDDANTTITNQSGGIYAYYFIDDVCLSTDSAFTQNYATDINKNSINETSFYYDSQVKKICIKELGEYTFKVIDLFGNTLIEKGFEGFQEIDVSFLENGYYVVVVSNQKSTKHKKIVVNV
ncbi:MAG: T9SS type A sorting domain-containing protein [Bacteroidota bacterium]|nr:T9SS type A sorting domain-containing protein [Bacteroidota bacterium]